MQKANLFENGEYVLQLDGFIKRIRVYNKKGKKRAQKKISASFISPPQDGVKFCNSCCKLVTVEKFGRSMRANSLRSTCNDCLTMQGKTKDSKREVDIEKKRFVDERRLEIIREMGCQYVQDGKECCLNARIGEMQKLHGEEFLLGLFEFNHKDGGFNRGSKLLKVSSYSCFTDAKARKVLGHDKGWKDLWKKEVAKCEPLCVAHHRMFTRETRESLCRV